MSSVVRYFSSVLCFVVASLRAVASSTGPAGVWSADAHLFSPQVNATYTIVNKANGRRISASERGGFFAIDHGPIYEDQMWVLAPLENQSHAIVNIHNGMRILAKSGFDMQNEFFTIKDGPIYQDQRWRLISQADGSYTIVNAKSDRRILARSGDLGWVSGFGAIAQTEPISEDQMWWLINQERDETGRLLQELQEEKGKSSEAVRLTLELQSFAQASGIVPGTACGVAVPCQPQEREVDDGSAMLLVGVAVTLLATLAAITAFSYRRLMRAEVNRNQRMAFDFQQERSKQTRLASELKDKQDRVAHLEQEFCLELSSMAKVGGGVGDSGLDFGFHMLDTEVDRETARLIKIQCPGVEHNDVEVQLIFNGCDVTIQRRASCGVEATTWKKRFQFRPADGLFEFKEDQMQLEHGFLHIVFRAYRFQSRVIRFPKHFPLATTDSDKWWEYPEDGAVCPGSGRPRPRKGKVTALKVSPDMLSVGKAASHIDTESTASTSMADPGDLTRR